MESRTMDADVVVVGAGMAGLCTARNIAKTGVEVAVLEARDRVGGRMFDARVRGAVLELGAGGINPGMTRLPALAEELGLETHSEFGDGASVVEIDGEPRELSPFSYETVLRGEAREQYKRAVDRLRELESGVRSDNPWESTGAEELDRATLASWLDANAPHPDAQSLFRTMVAAFWCADPAELSLLGFLFKISAAGGIDNYPTGAGDPSVFVEGPNAIARALAAQLDGSVHLEQPVRQVKQDGAGVEIVGRSLTVRARRCVMAVPPPVIARIGFDPPLPGDYAQLVQRLPMGAIVVSHVVFDRPFWRERGLSGHVLTSKAVFAHVYDSSPRTGAFGSLWVGVGAGRARELGKLDQPARKEAVLADLCRYFGEEALHPTDYVDIVWANEEWTRGGYSAMVYPPGVLTGLGRRLREPFGRVHWAGAETGATWCGSMEGAIESAERAARESLAAL